MLGECSGVNGPVKKTNAEDDTSSPIFISTMSSLEEQEKFIDGAKKVCDIILLSLTEFNLDASVGNDNYCGCG